MAGDIYSGFAVEVQAGDTYAAAGAAFDVVACAAADIVAAADAAFDAVACVTADIVAADDAAWVAAGVAKFCHVHIAASYNLKGAVFYGSYGYYFPGLLHYVEAVPFFEMPYPCAVNFS